MPRTIVYHGFSLIEVMIAVAIIAILATVAYPSYQESVRKAKRAEGRAALMQLMQQQERYYSQHSTYVAFSPGSADPDAGQFKRHSGESADNSAYEISGAACEGGTIEECVVLTARPDARFTDPRCGKLALSSTGKKTADGNDCW